MEAVVDNKTERKPLPRVSTRHGCHYCVVYLQQPRQNTNTLVVSTSGLWLTYIVAIAIGTCWSTTKGVVLHENRIFLCIVGDNAGRDSPWFYYNGELWCKLWRTSNNRSDTSAESTRSCQDHATTNEGSCKQRWTTHITNWISYLLIHIWYLRGRYISDDVSTTVIWEVFN
jgi:hypothetical protein